MGMQFTVTVEGRVRLERLDASGHLSGMDAEAIVDDEVGYGSISVSDAEIVEATVAVTFTATKEDIEVEATDIEDFDAEQALQEAIDNYGAVIETAEFIITESPTGFDTVTAAVGYDEEVAKAVYAALARAGLEVS
jgi:hypothetical protein